MIKLWHVDERIDDAQNYRRPTLMQIKAPSLPRSARSATRRFLRREGLTGNPQGQKESGNNYFGGDGPGQVVPPSRWVPANRAISAWWKTPQFGGKEKSPAAILIRCGGLKLTVPLGGFSDG